MKKEPTLKEVLDNQIEELEQVVEELRPWSPDETAALEELKDLRDFRDNTEWSI